MPLSDSQHAYLHFANLMCSKMSHDIIGPLGAIQNGFELLENENDENARNNILDIMQKSTHNAIAKMEFERLAMGLGNSTANDIHLKDITQFFENYLKNDSVPFEIVSEKDTLSKDYVRLLMNTFLIILTTVPRCKSLTINIHYLNDVPQFSLIAESKYARLDENIITVIQLQKNLFDLSPREILYYYTGLLAISCNMNITMNKLDEKIHVQIS